MLKENIKRIGL